jgi:hypothetical protein
MTRPNAYHPNGKPRYVFSYRDVQVDYVDHTRELDPDDVWLKAIRVGRRRGIGDPIEVYRQVWNKLDPRTGGKLSWIAATHIRKNGPSSPSEIRAAVRAALPHMRDDPWFKNKISKLLRLNKTFKRVAPALYDLTPYGRRVTS